MCGPCLCVCLSVCSGAPYDPKRVCSVIREQTHIDTCVHAFFFQTAQRSEALSLSVSGIHTSISYAHSELLTHRLSVCLSVRTLSACLPVCLSVLCLSVCQCARLLPAAATMRRLLHGLTDCWLRQSTKRKETTLCVWTLSVCLFVCLYSVYLPPACLLVTVCLHPVCLHPGCFLTWSLV